MLTLLCIDSVPQRLAQIKQDLQTLTVQITIREATSLRQAEDILLHSSQDIALLLCSQTLHDGDPISILKHPHCRAIHKIIYAATPSVDFLISGINQGNINHFFTLPYQREALTEIIQTQINICKSNNIQSQLIEHKNKKLKNSILDKTCFLEKPELASPADFQDGFLDYSVYSDSELSNLVIKSLYNVLAENDEHNVRRKYRPNHLLTHEGEINRFLWFISKGEVLLKKRNAQGESQDITIMQAGTMVGGMSFLTGEKAFSTGITLVETEVLKVDKAIFSQIMQSNSALLAPFTNLLLRNFNRRLQHSISTELALQETLQSLDAAHSKLVESEKMAVLGQLISGVAHELNNPVAAILRGSETLITLISSLLSYDSKSQFSLLAQKALQQGLTVRPLSTSEIRQRTKALLQTINDKKQAKQLVNMHLDGCSIPLENNRSLQESVSLLNKFHQAGTILRNSNACATRIANLVKSLKHYAGQDSDKTTATDIHEGLEETLIIFENKLKNYTVIKEYQPLPNIDCHPIELEQVWTNIISNAIDATDTTPGKGMLKISTVNQASGKVPSIQVIIEDNGPGIPAQTRAKIFDLNYTTKREGNFGLGIGLTICSQIIHRHNGFIEIESEENRFTRFIITLPVYNPHIESKHLSF